MVLLVDFGAVGAGLGGGGLVVVLAVLPGVAVGGMTFGALGVGLVLLLVGATLPVL